MKTVFTFSKYYKIIALFIGTILLLSLPSLVLVKHSKFDAEISCNKVDLNFNCIFSCVIIPKTELKEKEINGRAIVFHSIWTSIFDKNYKFKINEKNEINFEIPKRSYNYTLNFAFWDDKGNVGALNNSYKIIC